MSNNKKPTNGANNFCRQVRQINEGEQLATNGRQTLSDGFETRGAQFQTPINDPLRAAAGIQSGPVNLAPTNFQSPKVPKIPAKKS